MASKPIAIAGAGPRKHMASTIASPAAERWIPLASIASKSPTIAMTASSRSRPSGSQSLARLVRTAATSDPTRSTHCRAIATLRRVTNPFIDENSLCLEAYTPDSSVSCRRVLLRGASPLQVPAFRRLAISYGVNEFGDNFALIALAVLVFDQTGSALATAALFVAAKFIPAFVAPVVTARIDRLAIRVALPAIYSIEALVFGALALIAATSFSLAIVLLLAFIDGTLALTGRGLSRAAVAAVLGPTGGLRSGNALLNVIF